MRRLRVNDGTANVTGLGGHRKLSLPITLYSFAVKELRSLMPDVIAERSEESPQFPRYLRFAQDDALRRSGNSAVVSRKPFPVS